MSRTLIHVPIIHDVFSEFDWKAGEEFMSSPVITDYLQESNLFWDKVEEELKDRKIDRIYQDSFHSREGYQILVEKRNKSRNFNCVLSLEEKGAELMITEDLGLAKAFLYVRQHIPEHKDLVNHEREKFIAKNIDETLLENETGVLFLGAKHNKGIVDLFEELYSDIILEAREEPKTLDTLGKLVEIKYKYGI